MEAFGKNIWTVPGDNVRMFGMLPFTTRMTVVRLASGQLWLHSPVAPTTDRREAVDRLGPVAMLVAPNKIHSLGVTPWKTDYPMAEVWVSPGFPDRHPEIAADAVLTDEAVPPWRDEIDHCVIAGHAVLDEVAFLHRPSRTLILTDLIQKHDPAGERWLWRGVKGLAGILGDEGGVPLDVKLSVRDKPAMRASLERILAWEFDNLVISHGHCLQGGAKESVARAFAWITRS
ncbi:MAG: DUF4336 domain-containing protein [Pseudomonadota bacterium]